MKGGKKIGVLLYMQASLRDMESNITFEIWMQRASCQKVRGDLWPTDRKLTHQ